MFCPVCLKSFKNLNNHLFINKDFSHKKYLEDNNLERENRSSTILDRQILFDLYFVKKMSRKQCALFFNTHTRTIINNFKIYNWEFRTKSQVNSTQERREVAAERFRQLGLKNKGRKFSKEINKKKGRFGHICVFKGKTKENSESIKRMSEKLKGRNKSNNVFFKNLSDKMKLETKENSERRRKQAESNYVISTKECREFLRQCIVENKNVFCKEIILWKARRKGFRWLDILRSFDFLRDENDDVFKYIRSNSSAETKIENEVLVPYFENNFPDCFIQRQFSIEHNRLDILVLLKKSSHFIVSETKSFLSNKISKNHFEQLLRYSEVSDSKFYLLSDGRVYHWFEKQNQDLKKICSSNIVPEKIKSEYYNVLCCNK